MASVQRAWEERIATRGEVLAGRRRLLELAAAEGLRRVWVNSSGTVLVTH